MTTHATVPADARSTFVVTASFYNEDGDAVTPAAIHWSLRDEDNAVVNERTSVNVASPSTSVNIVLYGDDLALADYDNDSEIRRLVVAATYNSNLGTNLPLMGVYEFRVLNTYAAGLLPSVSPSSSASPSA